MSEGHVDERLESVEHWATSRGDDKAHGNWILACIAARLRSRRNGASVQAEKISEADYNELRRLVMGA